ncbi:MAG: DUF167 family protein [Proteobacteria bacterium]|nr:DUF167 family protein [Pseudomonadota bacterium]
MPFEAVNKGVRVRLRLTPGASADGFRGVAADQKGVAWLTATVTAVPEDGRANKALIRLLAKQWRIAKSSIQLTSGQTDRRKILLVEGDPATLLADLTRWLERQDP